MRSIIYIAGSLLLLVSAGWAQNAPTSQTAVASTEIEVLEGDRLEAAQLEAAAAAAQQATSSAPIAPTATEPTVDDDDYVVYLYLQDPDVVFHIRWHAITHISSTFVEFDINGDLDAIDLFNNWTNRSTYLRSGGAADAAGVKVKMTLNSFDDGVGGAIRTVMADPVRRTNLVNQTVAAVTGDAYAHGVNLDFEFSWDATTRDNLTLFISELRAALPSQYELSVYTQPTYNSNFWDMDATTGITPHIDFMLYSCYEWSGSTTPRATSDFNNYILQMENYMTAGLPPEKMVPTISTYGRRWENVTSYGSGGGSNRIAWSFADGLFDTTLNTNFGGPYALTHVTGDEVSWYTYNDGGTDYTAVFEGLEGIERKLRDATSFTDTTATFNGRRLRGVGFWSALWMAEELSHDMNTSTNVARTRTYPHIYQLCQEIFAPNGTTRFLIEGYEGLDFRWRDPDDSPDNTNSSANSRALAAAPGGAGQPVSTTNAMRVDFNFTAGPPNNIFFRHELLAPRFLTSVADRNAPAAVLDSTTAIYAFINTPAAYAGRQVRMAVVDNAGQLELSDPYSLGVAGWQEIEWDLTDAAQINAGTTSEAFLTSGNGTLDTAGGGAKDIGFLGFVIEGGGAGTGTVYFDEISYEHRNPNGLNYVINEFRYDDSGSDDQEFVEIYGPAGAMPASMELWFFDSAGLDGTISVGGGVIPDDGGGFGHYVFGDAGVPNVDQTTAVATGDDIPNTNPSGIQLVDTATGSVHDSVVYEAWGGLSELLRPSTLNIADEGYPWLGRVGPGTNSAGAPHTVGRYPSGADTNVNADDFGLQVATPGAANGGTITDGALPVSYDFTAVPSPAFWTFDTPSVTNPTGAGLPASSGGGNAMRVIDLAGGGIMGFLGDAALGASGSGYNVEGEIYIPLATDTEAQIAIGFCTSQGSTYFSNITDNAAYENGYWLKYENRAGVSVLDGRADHPGVWEFVHASHDNQDGDFVDFLGSATNAALGGATPGTWVPFRLTINPSGASGQQILAKINGIDVYRGDIPDGGPTSGAVGFGYRETGTITATTGTWVDSVVINTDNNISSIPIPVSLSGFIAE